MGAVGTGDHARATGLVMRTRRLSHLAPILLLLGPVALAACSSSPPIATFKMPPGPSRLVPLSEDVPVLTARLRALGDTGAKVVVDDRTVVIRGGGALPAPAPFFVETGRITLRPVYCGAPAYSPPPAGSVLLPGGALPSCDPAYSLTADNLAVDEDTGQPANTMAPDPGFAHYVSTNAADADVPSTTVLLPAGGSSVGGSYPRYVLGPAQVANSDIASTQATRVAQSSIVTMTLTAAGAAAWNQLAQQAFHAYVGVDLDGVAISAAIIEPTQATFVSFGDQFQLSGDFTKTSARELAALLSAGPLPAPLEPAS